MGLFYADIGKLEEIANLFWQFIRNIRKKRFKYSVYFLEDVLLPKNPHCSSLKENLSIILPKKSKTEKEELEMLWTERLPAHLSVKIYYLDKELYDFDKLYTEWRLALAQDNEDRQKISSDSMLNILIRTKNTSTL